MKSHNYRRDLLPSPVQYFKDQGLKLNGTRDWRSAICPFHDDRKPSLTVHIGHGGFKCMACGVKGGDVLDFHRQKYGLGFIEAAKELGAWKEF